MKKYSVLQFLLIMILFCSCKKYLEEKPDKSQVVPVTIRDLQGLLDDAYVMNLGVTPSMPESSSDDFFVSDDSYNSNNETSRNTYIWNLKEYNFSNDWSSSYNTIYNTNICLQQIDKISPASVELLQWANVKGSALFYRGYAYFNLVSEYSKAYDPQTADADMGIVIREGTDYNMPSVRSTVKQSYDKVLTDVKQSLDFLPETSLGVLRPSKAAAFGLLARTYLAMRSYDSAWKYANAALQINATLLDYNTLDVSGSSPFPGLDNPETVFYSEMNASNYLHINFQALVDTLLYQEYDQDDLRKQAFFFDNQGYHSFKGMYTTTQYHFSGIARDELFLIRAECYARKDLIAEGMADLNTLLLSRWNNSVTFVPVSAATRDEAVNKILMERRKELLLRGLRWMDIKRLNKEGYNIIPKRKILNQSYELLPNDHRYALPIPADIIRITGIPQNQ